MRVVSSASATWCMIESQHWVGSDVIRPDCSVDPTDPSCADPSNVTADNQRMANLYDDTLLCDDCFLKLFHLRLSSAYLPDTDYSDYLVEQFQDMQNVCTTALPELTTRGPFYYATVTSATSLNSSISVTSSGTAATTTGAATATATAILPFCQGQVIDTGSGVTSSDPVEACNELSLAFGVTTGDLQAATESDECYTPELVCLPEPCDLLQVLAGATCTFSNSTFNVTTTQFLTWNPNIIGLCDLLQEGQYICASSPGGTYIPPPNPPNDTNAGGQERGGPGGSDPTAITGTPTLIVTSTPLGVVPTAAPAPTQPGIAPDCNSYALSEKGDSCESFASRNKITPTNLYAWNTVLGVGGANCNTQLFAAYYYCVGVGQGASRSTTTSTSTNSATSSLVPSPTQVGITPFCTKYSITTSGTSCSQFAQDNSISLNDLYTWNTVLGSGGSLCNTQLFAKYYYCVGIAAPIPTQDGIATNCNDYAQAPNGDFCSQFAQEHNITTDDLYAWNTVLGSGGSNCASTFFAAYYYCIHVDS